jgi:hypothetical protein
MNTATDASLCMQFERALINQGDGRGEPLFIVTNQCLLSLISAYEAPQTVPMKNAISGAADTSSFRSLRQALTFTLHLRI